MIIKDVTEEEHLKNIAKLNQEIIKKASFRIYIVNENGIIEFVNNAIIKMSGTSREQFIGMNVFELPTYKKKPKGKIDEEIKKHIRMLGSALYSISPEIHEEDWNCVLKFAKENRIKNCQFWLRGWPDVPNPKVKAETIMKAMNLEEKYGVKIYFDINPEYIV